jgi:hypothetical protein
MSNAHYYDGFKANPNINSYKMELNPRGSGDVSGNFFPFFIEMANVRWRIHFANKGLMGPWMLIMEKKE